MRRANFIVGFNNWGKSSVVRRLFNDNRNFRKGVTYQLPNLPSVRFCVQTQSNDDVGQQYIDQIRDRLEQTEKFNPDLFAALCPSMETTNDYRQILREPVFSRFNQLNLLLLIFKWDHHAKLIESNIRADLNGIPNINFFPITADEALPPEQRTDAKVQEIRNNLERIYNI
jgi:hypothetical protein